MSTSPPNFERLVLGCIEADFCNQILVVQRNIFQDLQICSPFFAAMAFSSWDSSFCTLPQSKHLATLRREIANFGQLQQKETATFWNLLPAFGKSNISYAYPSCLCSTTAISFSFF